jgi:hypothetical protein
MLPSPRRNRNAQCPARGDSQTSTTAFGLYLTSRARFASDRPHDCGPAGRISPPAALPKQAHRNSRAFPARNLNIPRHAGRVIVKPVVPKEVHSELSAGSLKCSPCRNEIAGLEPLPIRASRIQREHEEHSLDLPARLSHHPTTKLYVCQGGFGCSEKRVKSLWSWRTRSPVSGKFVQIRRL